MHGKTLDKFYALISVISEGFLPKHGKRIVWSRGDSGEAKDDLTYI